MYITFYDIRVTRLALTFAVRRATCRPSCVNVGISSAPSTLWLDTTTPPATTCVAQFPQAEKSLWLLVRKRFENYFVILFF